MNTIVIGESNIEIFIDGHAIIADKAISEIESFAFLPNGWDYGRGGSIAAPIRDKALRWLNKLQSFGFNDVQTFPGEAEIMLAVSANNHYFELIVESDLSITISYDYKKKRVSYLPRMSDEEASQVILAIKGRMVSEGPREKKWSALGYFILDDTTKRSANLLDLHFAIPAQQTLDYLLWSGNASVPEWGQFAHTFEHTTRRNFQTLLGSRPFFGDLTLTQNYQADIR
jgi:hypothetical protein